MSVEELVEFAASSIDEQGAVPKQVFIVDEIPLIAVAKIFKPALRQLETTSVTKNVIHHAIGEHEVVVETIADTKAGQITRIKSKIHSL